MTKFITSKDSRIKEAYQNIKSGGLAVIPSRVGYTLLGNSDKSIKKMYKIKGRPLSKPCVVLTRRDFLEQIANVPAKYIGLIDAIEEKGLLCGFILRRKDHDIFNSLSLFANQYSKRDDTTSCFVINAGKYIQYLVDEGINDNFLVVGSSANKSGTGNEGVFERIPDHIKTKVDFLLEDDMYVNQEYNPITREQGVMIDLTTDSPIVIRKGLRYFEIQELITKHS